MFFDSNTTETLEFAPLPIGLYTITCVQAEYGPTKDGTGAILKVEFNVEGQGEQKLRDNFNLENSNEMAVKIGRSQLKALCEKIKMQSFS